MKVREILRVKGNRLLSVEPSGRAVDAVKTMAAENLGSLVVMEGGSMVGLLTFHELLGALGYRPTVVYDPAHAITLAEDGMPDVEFDGFKYFTFPMDHHEFIESGVIGNPLRATKENRARFETIKAQLETRNLELKGDARKVGETLDGARIVHLIDRTGNYAAERMRVDFGKGCAFDAAFYGDGVRFPGSLPAGCEAACRGRASLSGLQFDRLSESGSEAAALRDPAGRGLCG